MAPGPNPFKPTAGKSPPELIGREPLLEAIADSIADGPGAPGRLSIFTGPRGVGKTVMLNEVEALYDADGWHRVSLTAAPGFMHDLSRRASELLEYEVPAAKGRITGLSTPGGMSVNLERPPPRALELRGTVERLLDAMAPRGSGLLITLDEVHGAPLAELRDLAVMTQHLVRDDRQIAVAMAGLTSAVSDLLNDEVLTFMRRADRHELESLHADDVEDAFQITIRDNGRSIDDEACRIAAEATRGYPYLVQLVGHQIWRSTTAEHISMTSVRRGVEQARRRLRTLVHEPALNGLSDLDRSYLFAMSEDHGPTRVSDLAVRMGRSPQHVNTYRSRLIAAGVIEPAGRGRVRFAIPYLDETLRAMASGGD
jgi:AAA ATPase-like protein